MSRSHMTRRIVFEHAGRACEFAMPLVPDIAICYQHNMTIRRLCAWHLAALSRVIGKAFMALRKPGPEATVTFRREHSPTGLLQVVLWQGQVVAIIFGALTSSQALLYVFALT